MPKVSVDRRISKIENRFGRLENLIKQGFSDVKKDITTNTKSIVKQEVRLIVKQEVGQGFEEMGRMVKAGFDEMDRRFEAVDERFEAVDRRFDGVDIRLASINRRLSQAVYESQFDELAGRVTVLEHRAGISKK